MIYCKNVINVAPFKYKKGWVGTLLAVNDKKVYKKEKEKKEVDLYHRLQLLRHFFSCVYILPWSYIILLYKIIAVLILPFFFWGSQIASRSGTPITPSAASASATQTIC